jgi:3'-phosphoadenosine 5'-phosphosulfate sulfotransferase (PAPS reductase)/FAD synthetase
MFDPYSYDCYIVYFSGGKDSFAAFLYMLEIGIEPEKIEFAHHLVDGKEGSDLMDWPCTGAYCQAAADAFGRPIYYSWKVGGFEREMLRQEAATAPTMFEIPCGLFDEVHVGQAGGKSGRLGTRRRFPQVSHNLNVRWCSGYLKIDVADRAITNQQRFAGIRTLTISGERTDESSNRAKLNWFEVESRASGRHVDRWRPMHSWTLEDVWSMMERWRINPHPAYRLHWGRTGCQMCIFGSANQWASNRKISPSRFGRIGAYEREFGHTIRYERRDGHVKQIPVAELADDGLPYDMAEEDIRAALSPEWTEPIILPDGQWKLPAGAFGEQAGPS